MAVQAKVLRVLQEKEVIRLGDNKVIPVDIRVIAATHVDLKEAVNQGKFREDLFYRVNVLKLVVPDLSQRGEDICFLAEHFLHKIAQNFRFEADALRALLRYDWPGNVRELHNFIERLLVMSEGERITKWDVLTLLPEEEVTQTIPLSVKYSRRLKDEDFLDALQKADGNQTMACEMLGVNRSTLWRSFKTKDQENQRK